MPGCVHTITYETPRVLMLWWNAMHEDNTFVACRNGAKKWEMIHHELKVYN